MSKKVSCLSIFVLVLAFSGVAQAELLPNPGFEDGEEFWATWGGGSGSGAGGYFWDSSYHAEVLEDDTAHSGGKYMTGLLQDREGWWWNGMWIMQNHAVTPGKAYQLSGWVRDGAADGAPSLIEGDLRLTWEWRVQAPDSPTGPRYDEVDPDGDGNTGEHRNNTPFDLTEEWTYVSDVQVAPETAFGVTVGFLVSAGTTIDVDDASFVELGLMAMAPDPADNASDVYRLPTLSWTPGPYADTHDLYFGADFNDVNDATATVDPAGVYKGNKLPGEFVVTEKLEFGRTYYWRVDGIQNTPEFDMDKGDVWQFTVEPYSVMLPSDQIAATASTSISELSGPEKTIDGSGLDEDGLHSKSPEEMWMSASPDQSPWLQYEFDAPQKLDKILIWNSNNAAEAAVGWGIKGVEILVSMDGVDWTLLPEPNELAQGDGLGLAPSSAETVDLGLVTAQYVKLNILSNWGGVLSQYGVSEVQFYTIPTRARTPEPASGSEDVLLDSVVTWRPGREAGQHIIYVSTDADAVADGTAPSTTSNTNSIDFNSLDPELGETYYWRVDEVNDAEVPSVWSGPVWSLTAAASRMVDDFDSYGNLSPDRPFQTWLDGFGFSEDEYFPVGYPGNGTGAGVGHDIWTLSSPHYGGSIMETGIVRPGNSQSMPFYFTGGTLSQIDRHWSSPQDWSTNGIEALVVYFYGDEANTGDLYAMINDTKIPYDGDTEDLALPEWTLWQIDLTSLSVDSVSSLSIGVENAGADGLLLIDDVVLYKTVP